MWEAILDAVKDSLITLLVIFLIYILISFIETWLSNLLEKKSKFSPLIGALVGSVPQCGLVVVATDMYTKRHITVGTLLAIFIACSDEALPILIASPSIYIVYLILSKIVIGFIAGYLIDLLYTRSKKEVKEHTSTCDHAEMEIHHGCCHHSIEKEEKDNGIHAHLIHPLIHSLKIFIYILIVNLVINIIITLVGGEEVFSNFVKSAGAFSPLFAVLVGLIPNCSSSVVLTEVFLKGGISFGACLGGLCANAGLGLVILFKNKNEWKNNLKIFGILAGISLVVGYIFYFIGL